MTDKTVCGERSCLLINIHNHFNIKNNIFQQQSELFTNFIVELSMIGDTISERLVKVEIVKFSRSEKFTILPLQKTYDIME